jgi:hypothetical protein
LGCHWRAALIGIGEWVGGNLVFATGTVITMPGAEVEASESAMAPFRFQR